MNIVAFLSSLLLFTLTSGSLLYAEGRNNPPNFYVDTQFAFSTVKSKMLLSNDTGTALRYGVGTFAGSDGQIGFQLMNDSDTTTFALNSSALSNIWQDTTIRYYMGPFYVGALFTRAEIKAKNQGVDTIDAAGSGMGGGVGLLWPVGRGGSISLDIATASIPKMKNSLPQEIAIGQRLDLDLGASVDITSRLLDFTFGYRTRTLGIKADANYTENFYQTYVGLRMSFFF